MIPKVIHFCWLSGDPYPQKIQYCIDSWKKYLSDYEIRLWDLNRFDINSSLWCKEALSKKKYAFVADYIRNYALYHDGGIYLDSDVEVLRSFDELLRLPYFIGRETSGALEPAIMGAERGHLLHEKMLHYYENRHFVGEDGAMDMKTCPDIMNEIVADTFTVNNIEKISEFKDDHFILNVFPAYYFSPKRMDNFKVEKTSQTFSIHHFNASWFPNSKKLFTLISKIVGFKAAVFLSKCVKKIIRSK